jgi:hypothetical protein
VGEMKETQIAELVSRSKYVRREDLERDIERVEKHFSTS